MMSLQYWRHIAESPVSRPVSIGLPESIIVAPVPALPPGAPVSAEVAPPVPPLVESTVAPPLPVPVKLGSTCASSIPSTSAQAPPVRTRAIKLPMPLLLFVDRMITNYLPTVDQ